MSISAYGCVVNGGEGAGIRRTSSVNRGRRNHADFISSIHKKLCVGVCVTYKERRHVVGPVTPVAVSVRPMRFPSCRAPGTS